MNFENEVKAQIKEVIDKVKSNSIQGRFVSEEQLHLTLEFLGEIEKNRLDLIKESMDDLQFNSFTLYLTKVGYFKRNEGNIYWLGVKEDDTLFKIQKHLHQSLLDKGFELENREYKPHITLGRKIKLKDSFNASQLDDAVKKIKIDIDKIDLMKSDFISGGVKYSVIYSKSLEN